MGGKGAGAGAHATAKAGSAHRRRRSSIAAVPGASLPLGGDDNTRHSLFLKRCPDSAGGQSRGSPAADASGAKGEPRGTQLPLMTGALDRKRSIEIAAALGRLIAQELARNRQEIIARLDDLGSKQSPLVVVNL